MVFSRLSQVVGGTTPTDIIDVIQWTDVGPQDLVQRYPSHGPGTIRIGAQLVVRENQAAIFVRDGKALDVFGPGRHTLETANIPLLNAAVKGLSGGEEVFTAEVFFVNQAILTDFKWGTPNPIDLKDPDLGWVQLRAFGSYTLKIQDPNLFVNTLVGQQNFYDGASIANFLKGTVRTRLNDLLGTVFQSYASIRSSLDEFSAAMKLKVGDDFQKYGLELRDFFVQDVSVPEEIQEAFRMRAKMSALGIQGPNAFSQYQAAQALTDMAKNPGAGGQMMQMGAGMSMGMMYPAMMHQQMGYGHPPGYAPHPPQGAHPPQQPPAHYPPQQPPHQPQASAAQQQSAPDVAAQLKALVDAGVLTEEEYQAKLKQIQG